MISQQHICTVCGYTLLSQDPWDFDESQPYPSWDICPSCGTHFGYYDFGTTKEEIISRQKILRKQWIASGMKWGWSMEYNKTREELRGEPDDRKPNNWNPKAQLKNIPKEFLGDDEKY